jgi:hypothetical protein
MTRTRKPAPAAAGTARSHQRGPVDQAAEPLGRGGSEPGYEADNGPLTSSQLTRLRKLAASQLPDGELLRRSRLV